jgi:hypothetical protein
VDFLLETFAVLSFVNRSYIEKIFREGDRRTSNIFPSISLSINQVMTSI